MRKSTIERKRDAVMKALLGGHKLHKIGSSYMLAVPAAWCRLYAWQINSNVWVKLTSDAGKLIVEPIDKDRAFELMEANDVKL